MVSAVRSCPQAPTTMGNIDLGKLFHSDYLFTKTPPADSDYRYLVILFGVLIVIAVSSWVYFAKKKKQLSLWGNIQGRVFNLFLYIGIIGLVLIFFRWQEIPYVGSRFFLIILLVAFLLWAAYVMFYRFIIFKELLANNKKKEEFEKYLPSSRKLSDERKK